MAESANAGLGNHKFAAGKSQSDLAFFFSALGFEDGGIALNCREAAAFALVRSWALRSFVFINARKFDLKTLFTQCPDLFTVFRFPGAVDLSGRNAFVAARLNGNN